MYYNHTERNTIKNVLRKKNRYEANGFTTEDCVDCNRCIEACSCHGANIAKNINWENILEVDMDSVLPVEFVLIM